MRPALQLSFNPTMITLIPISKNGSDSSISGSAGDDDCCMVLEVLRNTSAVNSKREKRAVMQLFHSSHNIKLCLGCRLMSGCPIISFASYYLESLVASCPCDHMPCG